MAIAQVGRIKVGIFAAENHALPTGGVHVPVRKIIGVTELQQDIAPEPVRMIHRRTVQCQIIKDHNPPRLSPGR
ncbi:hypothetical protein QQ054_34140 [Oscillatoria amoena NRMC-F 0135]|nr:hypothetical protein [Oscillatoria amoena NRMC-F 0135]